jgi:hypothetical protein
MLDPVLIKLVVGKFLTLGTRILEILCCDPKETWTFFQVLSTVGRGVGLCWASSKSEGLTAESGFCSVGDTCPLNWFMNSRSNHQLPAFVQKVRHCYQQGRHGCTPIMTVSTQDIGENHVHSTDSCTCEPIPRAVRVQFTASQRDVMKAAPLHTHTQFEPIKQWLKPRGCTLQIVYTRRQGRERHHHLLHCMGLHGYLAHERTPPPKTLQQA